MNDLGDVFGAVGAVVLSFLAFIAVTRLFTTSMMPKPIRQDDGAYAFFGRVSFPRDGSPERNKPILATIRVNDERLTWKVDNDDQESAKLSSIKIVRASRFKRSWGATGAMNSGLDLLLNDGRVLRVKLESNWRSGDTRRLIEASEYSKLATWLERELGSRGVPFCDAE